MASREFIMLTAIDSSTAERKTLVVQDEMPNDFDDNCGWNMNVSALIKLKNISSSKIVKMSSEKFS